MSCKEISETVSVDALSDHTFYPLALAFIDDSCLKSAGWRMVIFLNPYTFFVWFSKVKVIFLFLP